MEDFVVETNFGILVSFLEKKNIRLTRFSSSCFCCCLGIAIGFAKTKQQLIVIVQTVENGEWAFLMAMGTVIKKTLGEGEQILVDGNSILCFESSVTVDVRTVGGIAAMCCGGEGIFNTELTGKFV